MIPSNPFWPRHSFVFFGGGGGAIATPAPVIAAPAAPAPSTTSVEVTQAKLEAARLAKQRQGINATVLGNGTNAAGATNPQGMGGSGQSGSGKGTVLGGG